jgi:hypothetical protein
MPNLAPLYTRTPQGRLTAFNPAAQLPAPLKTLLKAVDGKTTTSALQSAHTALGDVASLLAILQDNGLIADKNENSVRASLAPAPNPAPPLLDNAHWANSDNALLDSSFGDFGTSMFSQLAVPPVKKPE